VMCAAACPTGTDRTTLACYFRPMQYSRLSVRSKI
jgi:hypothetical protein